MSEPLRVVVLCTGNRFRSPLAAAVLRRATEGLLPVDVSSAGTLEVDGLPALGEALALAPGHGVDLGGHVAQRLRRGELASADLVLGFEKFHLAAAVVDGGAARSRVYTLPEIVGLLEELDDAEGTTPVERARARLAAAADLRGTIGRPPEIADPFGEPAERQHAIADEVVALTERLASLLAA
jgi:protein-tyrosine phosphatase